MSEHSQVVAFVIPGDPGARGTQNGFVRRSEIIAQGRPLPKRDIVDTYFHASRAARLSTATETPLPTTWGNGNSREQGLYGSLPEIIIGLHGNYLGYRGLLHGHFKCGFVPCSLCF